MRQPDYAQQRERLINAELRDQGIRNEAVLQAMRAVPREEFLPDTLREFAYRNVPLPIGMGQTISQPWIVARMAEALELRPSDRLLEIGTGSGYAAAVLSKLAAEVFSVERLPGLADSAAATLERLKCDNVHVLVGDGTLGWPDHAPYEAIVVAAGGPSVPPALLQQLQNGGRLVMPVGKEQNEQELIRITRQGPHEYRTEKLGGVRFVPLIGAAGWEDVDGKQSTEQTMPVPSAAPRVRRGLPGIIRDCAEPFCPARTPDLRPLLNRIGRARLVLIGEASHGTSEFYRLRAAITRALIAQKGFSFVAVEADWPDAYRLHDFVTHKEREEPHEWEAFARFPTWMWRNHEVLDFIHWLRDFNLDQKPPAARVGFYGLDLYSLFTSIHAVLTYLDRIDPEAASLARLRYGCLSPWEGDPATYGRAALNGRYRSCEAEVIQMLRDLSQRRFDRALRDGDDLFDAQMNARLIADAERYYRVMYYGSDDSWNLRDTHMFDVLKSLLARYGDTSKAIIWAHNSHLGNAAATQFGTHGQINIGQLCRQAFGDAVYAIGFGTDHGTVAAATEWEAPMEVKQVRPAHPQSYERVMHLTEMEAFFLPMKRPSQRELISSLSPQRLERAIGVIYRPETERQSHYFYASLPRQFDEWIWIDETTAITPLSTRQTAEHEPRHPFATLDE